MAIEEKHLSFSRLLRSYQKGTPDDDSDLSEAAIERRKTNFLMGRAYEEMCVNRGDLLSIDQNPNPLKTKLGREYKAANPESISTTQKSHLDEMVRKSLKVKILGRSLDDWLSENDFEHNPILTGKIRGEQFLAKPDLVFYTTDYIILLELKTLITFKQEDGVNLRHLEHIVKFLYYVQLDIYKRLVRQRMAEHDERPIITKWLFAEKQNPHRVKLLSYGSKFQDPRVITNFSKLPSLELLIQNYKDQQLEKAQ